MVYINEQICFSNKFIFNAKQKILFFGRASILVCVYVCVIVRYIVFRVNGCGCMCCGSSADSSNVSWREESNSQSHVKDPLPLRVCSGPAKEQSGSDWEDDIIRKVWAEVAMWRKRKIKKERRRVSAYACEHVHDSEGVNKSCLEVTWQRKKSGKMNQMCFLETPCSFWQQLWPCVLLHGLRVWVVRDLAFCRLSTYTHLHNSNMPT